MAQGIRLKTKYILWRNIIGKAKSHMGIEFYGGSQRGWVRFADQAYQYSPPQASRAAKSFMAGKTRSAAFMQKVVSVIEIDDQTASPEIQKHMKVYSRRFK